MKRADKEIKEKIIIESILKKAFILRIGLIDGANAYIIPMNFGYSDNCIYLHSAKDGRKIDLIKENNNISFEAESDIEIVKNETACKWGMKYFSVIGNGRAFFIEDNKEKKKALLLIMEKYSGNMKWNIPDASLKNICILKIVIEKITGKKSGY